MKILKIIAVLLNAGILIFVLVMTIQNPKINNLTDLLIYLLLFGTPIINLLVIFLKDNQSSWFGLFLKRKALEEQRKIEELEKKRNNGN